MWITAGAARPAQGSAPATDQATYQATVSVATTGKATGAIGNGFVGLSFEAASLSQNPLYDDAGNLAQLLRNLGSSVMRFGGSTVDRSFTGTPPSTLAGLARLARSAGWSVLYTENLIRFNKARVTGDARVVSQILGSRLFAFACGNEPDGYAAEGLRPKNYTVGEYLVQARTCFQAIRAGAPHAPLEGPDASWSAAWTAAYAAKEAGTISWVGQHYYPVGCTGLPHGLPAQVSYMLSPGLAAREATTLTVDVADARAGHVPLIMTETNTACYGGIAGLSNSYAAALWAIDYLLTGAEHGVHAMNFHGGLNSMTHCTGYTVFCQTGTRYYFRPQPIYYGMLFAHLLGTGKFLPVKISSSSRAENLAAFALRPSHGGGLRLMVENLGKDWATATLRVGAYRGAATVLRLSGSSPLATSGAQIQGVSVAADGSYATGRPATVLCTSHGCPLTLAPYSAALVRLG